MLAPTTTACPAARSRLTRSSLGTEPVDGEELLTELSEAIGAYVIMDEHQRDAAALWAAHAHAHDFRDTSPPLVIKSPAMRSGKTKLVEVLERLVPRPLFVSGITVSFLERAIEAHRPTLLIDEYDALTSNDPALAEAARAQLNRSAQAARRQRRQERAAARRRL